MDSLIILLFALVVVVGIILLVVIATTRKGPKGLDVEQYRSRWLKITASVTHEESSRHLAIMNADSLLDQAMQDSGITGATMGERLKNAKSSLKHRDAIWQAHKLRNRIAHEGDVKVSPSDAKKALAAFKSALKDIGAL
jgi:hypothetical protein